MGGQIAQTLIREQVNMLLAGGQFPAVGMVTTIDTSEILHVSHVEWLTNGQRCLACEALSAKKAREQPR